MYHDLKKIKCPPLNTICFSDNRKSMYGFSKYYNELFEVDLKSNKMISLGKIQSETDRLNLAFQIEYYKEKIIIIPRFANCICIYDCETGEQHEFNIIDILDGRQYNFMGFFFCIYNESLYLIHRQPVMICKLNLKTYKHTVLYDDTCTKKCFLSLFNQIGKYAACFAIDINELFLFDAEKESFLYITLPVKCAGFASPFFDGEFIWLYHMEKNVIYKCNILGELLSEWSLKHELDLNGLFMIFRMINNKLYLFPNKQNCYFCIEDNKVVLRKCELVENDICWLVGDDGNNPCYICIEWDGKGSCPHQDTYSIINFKYRILNLADSNFVDIVFDLNLEENIHKKIVQSLKSFFPEGIIMGENSDVPFLGFLEMVAYKETEPKIQSQEFLNIGSGIYSNVLLHLKSGI